MMQMPEVDLTTEVAFCYAFRMQMGSVNFNESLVV